MKTKNLFVVIAAFCSLTLMTGCNSKQAKITIFEDDAENLVDVIGGDDFFEPVPGVYNVNEKKGTLSVTIPVKIKKGKRYPNYIVEELNLYPLDATDSFVRTNDKNVAFLACNKEAAYQSLCAASIGDVVNVDFQYTPTDKKTKNAVLEAIVSCEIDLSIEEPDEDDDPTDVIKTVRNAQKEALNEMQKAQQEALKEVGDAYGKAAKEANDAYQQALKEANDVLESIW